MIRGLLLFTAVAGLATTANAYDRYEIRSIPVAAADLDLSTSAGVAELYRRVERAVNRICEGDRDCRDEAWASTEEQASAAIARDRWMRRLARERAAELRACGRYGCAPSAPVHYQPAPPMPLVVQGGTRVTVTIQTGWPGYYIP
ncbi:UrcA family protein [Sphingomonas sp. QA11]|uniref:UrcA family protein n=1 Tax=Sphingomonas sp. QA11 TaxID=2950605 RepID=UPI00234BC6F7|nr:UrcA family protein [Sphingomonas sp. QA11]WCM25447.1 UrcA family protein [Sphingomonas sp. QA11]